MKENKKGYPLYQRALSFLMAAALVFGILPIQSRAETVAENYPVDHVSTVADPQTIGRPGSIYGDDTLNAGKVTVGKSVHNGVVSVDYGQGKTQTFTPGQDNFIVTSSQAAQVVGLMSESAVPVDVVFVLDTSGSMDGGRSTSMVTAANNAIRSLMAANEHNRVGVVAFSSNARSDNTTAAEQLSALAHYNGDEATNHLRWGYSNGTVANGGSYIIGRGTGAGTREGIDGGTNIHAGIALGAEMLTGVSSTTVQIDGKTVNRMPFLVVLSDGAPTYSSYTSNGNDTKWYDPNMTNERGDGNNPFAGNGFLAALTAAYYKGVITEKYFGVNASEQNRCYIYTIGVGLDSLTGNGRELARITMNPREYFKAGSTNTYYKDNDNHDFDSYWTKYTAANPAQFTVQTANGSTTSISVNSINATKNYVNGLNANGVKMYNGGLVYNDAYYTANQTSDINSAFEKAMLQIQQQAMASPTRVEENHGADFSGYVTYTDPIGEYMEVKKVFGIVADGNYYQGKSFAQYISDWDSAPAEFRTSMIKVLRERCRVTGATMTDEQAVAFIKAAAASSNQAYYNSDSDYDNSIVWWGKSYTAPGEEDVQVQWLGFADNDTVEYITDSATAIPGGADYVCRSYYFYGTAGGTAQNANHDYLHFVIRVQRSLKAPYQETVVISAPASLLSMEKVMITEKKDGSGNATYSATVTEADPARVVYEVGLRSDINAFNIASILQKDAAYLGETAVNGGQTVNTNYDAATGTYHFYTNDWDRTQSEDSHHRAMTHATFDAAADNAFYTYTKDTPIYVKNGDTYTLYNGATKPVGEYYYAREVYDWSASTASGNTHEAVKKTVYILVDIPANSAVVKRGTDSWYIAKGAYKASSLSTAVEDVDKTPNATGTSTIVAHPHRTEDETNSHYTVLLGNNGKLSISSADTKAVDITNADNTTITDADGKVVMVGDTLTYHVKVVNGGTTTADAVVTDTIPMGTAYVENSADNGGVYDAAAKTITWNIADIPAGSYVVVSFQVTVTEEALSGEFGVASINNTAKVTLENGFSYETNPVTNPPEGKKVVDTEGNPITDGMEVPQVLVYRIRWHNDSGKTADVVITDIIPAGTTYVANSADEGGVYDPQTQTVTWTFEDVVAGTSGVVSFRVNVNPAAGEYVENNATITIDNNPRVTNTVKVDVDHGDLVLTKTVQANGYPDAMDQEFILNLTEIGLKLDGQYTMLRNGTEVSGGITFTKGLATVTIKHGDTIEIQGIPAGSIFSVVEVAKNGFTASYTVTGSGQPSSNEGRVAIVADSDVAVAVTNSYAPTAVNFQLKGTKELVTSLPLNDTVFGFTAYGCDANGENLNSEDLLTGEVTVSASSKTAQITFSPKVFSATGTYYYLISEINGGITGIDYAANQYLLTVVVTDNGSGALQAEATLKQRSAASGSFGAEEDYTDTGVTFVNTYAPLETQVTLTGSKVLTGRDLKAEEFSFVVTDAQGNVVANGLNAANGTITFSSITYTAPGTYTYTITETNGGLKGVDYDSASFAVTVTVVDNNGQLEATVTYPTGGVVFENTYTPDDVSVTIEGNKTITGRDLAADEFNFVVIDNATGNVVATGSNDATGKITFTAIGYTVADVGEHTYTVKEVVPDLAADPNLYYDPATFQVKVTVAYDSNTGILSASEPVIVGADAIGFANIQNPDSVEITPVGTKTTANAPDGVSFSFSVINTATGNVAGTGVGAANGNINFSVMSYSDPGTYTYWIVESNAGNTTNGITYDLTRYLMKVVVTRNATNKLEAEVTYWASAVDGSTDVADYTIPVTTPAFENSYAANGYINITAGKTLTGGRELKVGEFAFKLVRQDNNGEIDGVVTAVSGNDGTVTFATMYYSLSDLNGQDTVTLHYVMSEVIPEAAKLPGVTYDTRTYDVYVKLTDNGDGTISAELVDAEGNPLGSNDTGITFTNTYAPVEGTSATMEATKALTGRPLNGGEFGFELYHVTAEGETLVATATNGADGKISFTRNYPANILAGAASREIKYVMREINGSLGGVTYSGAEYWIIVTITDNTVTGKLESAVKYYADEACTREITDLSAVRFSNTYDAQDTTYTPTANKTLTNRNLADNEFSFVVMEGDKVVSNGLSKADGTVVFTPIGYTEAGTYRYTVSEVKGSMTGVGYTDVIYYLTVVVTDNLDGTMTAVGTYYTDAARTQVATNVVFANTYTPDPVSVQLQANKTLTGRDMTQGEFGFVVKLGDQVVATGGNAAAAAGAGASVVFSNIGYKLEDLEGAATKDFIYTISELKTSQGGVTFDKTLFYAKVTLTNNPATGRLETEVAYYSDAACQNELTAVAFENSYAPASTELVLPVDKTLINKVLEAGEFTFTLTDADGKVLQTKTNNADGSVTFDPITYTKPGTYIYTVTESVTDATKADRYTLDSSFTVVVTVVDDLKGNLIATATYHENDASGNYDPSTNLGGVEFINYYTAPALTVPLNTAIDATKTVQTPDGVSYSPAGFKFVVTDTAGNTVMGRDKNGNPVEMIGISDENGIITFPDFYFPQAGAYIYWIHELESGKNGVTDDARVWEVHILVRYNETTGLLYVNDSDVQTYPVGRSAADDTDPNFVNVYQPAPASLKLTAKKVLEGRDLKDREFMFYLMEGDLIVAQGYNDVNGIVTFSLNFTEVGKHTYTIKEFIPENGLGGVTYDTVTYGSFTVEVKDNGNGQLVVYVNGAAQSNGGTVSTGVTITNRYEAAPTSAQIQASKVLIGSKALEAGEYTFVLENTEDPTETYTATNDAAGNILFNIAYTKAGVYTYTLREIRGTDTGVTYDTSSFTVTVTVTDDLQGRLHAVVTYPDGAIPTFSNKYAPLSTQVILEGTKALAGRDLKAEEFSFVVTDAAGNVVSTGTNDATGKIHFKPITYTQAGVYTYTVTEVNSGLKGVTYSGSVYTIVVTVEDVDGQLVATPAYPATGLTFNNSYEPDSVNVTLSGNKTITGRDLVDGEFSFVVTDDATGKVVATGTNDASGNITFTAIGYTVADVGVHTYTVTEVVPDLAADPNLYYDPIEYKVKVTVTYDSQTGVLSVSDPVITKDGNSASISFANIQNPDYIDVPVVGVKTTTGNHPANLSFSFSVVDMSGNVVSGGSAPADGSIIFTNLSYTGVGTHYYWIYETNHAGQTAHGITYSGQRYLLEVKITRNATNALVAEVNYYDAGQVGDTNDYTTYLSATPIADPAENVSFENHYEAKGAVNLTAQKELSVPAGSNYEMVEGDFMFKLERVDENGNVLSTLYATNDADGNIQFPSIIFDDHDVNPTHRTASFRYIMSEVVTEDNDLPGITYSNAVYYLIVTITEEGGVITTSVKYYTDDTFTTPASEQSEPVFRNSYAPVQGTSVTIEATKKLSGRELAAGEFSFELFHVTASGETLVATAANDANGKISFTRNYPASLPLGTYKYVLREVNNHLGGVEYSGSEYWILVTVTDDGDGNLVASAKYYADEACTQEITDLTAVSFVNTYKARSTTYTPVANKVLTNRDMADDEFSFVVLSGDTVVSTGLSKADGTIVFTPIGYDAAGVYEYTVVEVKGNLSGVTYTNAVFKLVVTVVDDTTTGMLVATAKYYNADGDEVSPVFTNIYTPNSVSVTLEAGKTLTGRDMNGEEFRFEVRDLDGNLVTRGSNEAAADGAAAKVVFLPINYSIEDLEGADSKAFIYAISEIDTEQGGVTFDQKVFYAKVTVTNNKATGKLETSVKYYSDKACTTEITAVSFSNSYAPAKAELPLAAKKTLNGKTLEAGEFTFTLKDASGTVKQTKTNDANGIVTFDELVFTEPGTYIFTISESVTDDTKAERYTLDKDVTVVVTVVDNLEGKLIATAAYYVDYKGDGSDVDLGAAAFVNTYTAPSVTAEIKAHKTLLGDKPLTAEKYTFELVREDGVIITTTNLANGDVVFSLKYDTEGVYKYVLREKKGDELGTTYDPTTYNVTVTVENEGRGKLIAKVEYEGLADGKVPSFVNSYKGTEVPVKITATKTLTGKTLTADAYTFTLTSKEDPTEVYTAKNDADGNILFELVFQNTGTYTYILAETKGTDDHVTYDETKYTVTVKVTDDLEGHLVAEVSYDTTDGAAPVFENVYTPDPITIELVGTKELTGRKMKANDFTFEVRDSAGKVVATAKNTADGKLVFSGIELKEAGTYTFTVTEVKGNEKGMIYDTAKFTVTVKVTNENGVLKAEITYPQGGVVFKNTYKDPDPTNPSTGDETPLFLLIGLMLASGGAVVTMLTSRKKRSSRR